ncbi:hypothetical protein [uncultured Sphingomonas sp.]|uniref:hypothetical protein n=1 Tax=uncultured Sphingomonas sp. TaxID=158754 RepID=UPI0035CB2D5C
MRALILLPLALAACDDAADSADSNATATTNAAAPVRLSTVQQRVVDLSPQLRDGVLFRAIRDGGAECQGVAAAAREADQDGRPVWSARCTEGSAYLIAIGADGVAQVTKVSGDRVRG